MRVFRLKTVLAATFCVATLALGSASAAAPAAPPGTNPGASAAGWPVSTFTPAAVLPPSFLEATFVAIRPCRVVDTRSGGGAFGNGTTRDLYVSGTLGFDPQGGKSGGCGVPIGATAVAATITAVAPTGSGFVRTWPQGQTEPNATALNYPARTSNGTGGVIAIRAGAPAQALTVKNYGGPTNLVIDVTGYYAQQIQARILPTGGMYSGTARVLSATHEGPGSYLVTIDRDVSGCNATGSSSGGQYFVNAFTVGDTVEATTWTYVAGVVTPTDIVWSLVVLC